MHVQELHGTVVVSFGGKFHEKNVGYNIKEKNHMETQQDRKDMKQTGIQSGFFLFTHKILK